MAVETVQLDLSNIPVVLVLFIFILQIYSYFILLGLCGRKIFVISFAKFSICSALIVVLGLFVFLVSHDILCHIFYDITKKFTPHFLMHQGLLCD